MAKGGTTPRNKLGQTPTHSPAQTRQRLQEKAGKQRGAANRARTREKAR